MYSYKGTLKVIVNGSAAFETPDAVPVTTIGKTTPPRLVFVEITVISPEVELIVIPFGRAVPLLNLAI